MIAVNLNEQLKNVLGGKNLTLQGNLNLQNINLQNLKLAEFMWLNIKGGHYGKDNEKIKVPGEIIFLNMMNFYHLILN